MAHLTRAVVAFAAIAALVTACAPGTQTKKSAPPRTVNATTTVASNVRFADYAGTQACAGCHASYVARWRQTPMHNMTRAGSVADVKGPFDGSELHFHGDVARLEKSGADRFVTIQSARLGTSTYKLTRVIGGHHREDYAGISVGGVGGPVLGDATEELVLPVSFVLGSKTLRYKGYSVMVKERDGLKAGPVWNQTCIFCHNTVPYASTVLGALAGTGGYQGEVVDPLLPASMRAKYTVTDENAFRDLLRDEEHRLGSQSPPDLKSTIAVTRNRFKADDLVEVGIGCESCHLGAAAHAKDPGHLPSFEPISDAFAVTLPKENRAAQINRACARCHQVLFSGYEHTWEGGNRKRNPGGSNINSGEARDMMLGSCATKLACTGCHDVHDADGTTKLRALTPAREDALCTTCHAELASNDALKAHSHHDPAREGARCLGCHMPRKNMALDGTLSRYHRIGSPNDPAKVLLDRPIECALCHADKSVATLVTTMETWWKRPFERGALERLYGSLDANVVLATAERGKPHEQAVAFALLGENRTKAGIPVLAAQLTHPYPIVRGYAKRALDAILGTPAPIDIDASDEVIAEQAKRYAR